MKRPAKAGRFIFYLLIASPDSGARSRPAHSRMSSRVFEAKCPGRGFAPSAL